MKCNAWVAKGKTLKGTPKTVFILGDSPWGPVTNFFSEVQEHFGNPNFFKIFHNPKKYQQKWEIGRCGGSIVSEVSGYEGLEVSHTCQECGNNYFHGLPSEYNLSEWLTEQVEKL